MVGRSTIHIDQALKRRLRAMKTSARMSYNEVIWRMVEDIEDTSPAALRRYARIRKEMEGGNFITMEQLERAWAPKQQGPKRPARGPKGSKGAGGPPVGSKPRGKRP